MRTGWLLSKFIWEPASRGDYTGLTLGVIVVALVVALVVLRALKNNPGGS